MTSMLVRQVALYVGGQNYIGVEFWDYGHAVKLPLEVHRGSGTGM